MDIFDVDDKNHPQDDQDQSDDDGDVDDDDDDDGDDDRWNDNWSILSYHLSITRSKMNISCMLLEPKRSERADYFQRWRLIWYCLGSKWTVKLC